MTTTRGATLTAGAAVVLAGLALVGCSPSGHEVESSGPIDSGPDLADDRMFDDAADILDILDILDADAGKEHVDNVCDPACAPGLRCVDGECCTCCYTDCDAGTHCEWSGDQMVCVDDPCDPPQCGADTHCVKGTCVANVCGPPCRAYEYCDDQGLCQPYACAPACTKERHCEADNTCVANECPLDCRASSCGWGYCGRDGACVGVAVGCSCDCTDVPVDPVCGLTDQGGNEAFVLYDNLCELECASSVAADCTELPVQLVCDVAGYLSNPAGANTYDNVCYAACAGVDVEQLQAGACACSMTCADGDLGDQPVCGTDCETYANPCEATCYGVDVQYAHACEVGCGLCPECLEVLETSCLDPVCGDDGKTYLSLCDLEVCHPGVDLAYHGFCVGSSCPCAVTPNPVCGTQPYQEGWATLPNPCTANCMDATVWFQAACTCCDPRPEAPVCAHSPLWGQWYAERNQCVVDSYGYADVSYPGPCICCDAPGSVDGCCDLTIGPPVCGVDGVTYANECALTCAAASKASDGACPCPSTWQPVCGQSAIEPGKTYTYGNACIAGSVYGVTTFTEGACPLCAVACADAPDEPVCGLDGVSYPNACHLLKCNGDAIAKGLDDTVCVGACAGCP